MSQHPYDATIPALRAEHRTHVDMLLIWRCSCGKEGSVSPGTTVGTAMAASERHLRAEHKKLIRAEEARRAKD